MTKYIDYGLTDKYPNKYHLTPKSIKKLRILDWDRLKKKTWHNIAMSDTGTWWCHIEGCQYPKGVVYDGSDEFWIGFDEETNAIVHSFTCYDGMCHYNFDEFYSIDSIGGVRDLNVQVNAISWLNTMIDEGILGLPMETE